MVTPHESCQHKQHVPLHLRTPMHKQTAHAEICFNPSLCTQLAFPYLLVESACLSACLLHSSVPAPCTAVLGMSDWTALGLMPPPAQSGVMLLQYTCASARTPCTHARIHTRSHARKPAMLPLCFRALTTHTCSLNRLIMPIKNPPLLLMVARSAAHTNALSFRRASTTVPHYSLVGNVQTKHLMTCTKHLLETPSADPKTIVSDTAPAFICRWQRVHKTCS